MTSAYAIRRLLEAQKLSNATSSATVPALRYVARGKVPDVWNRHELEELYDLDSPTKTQLPLRKYCNQLIHSYVLQLNANEDSGLFDGVFVASEKDCREQVFFLPVKSMMEICVKIGREDIWGVYLRRDKDGAAYWVSYTREDLERLHNPPLDESSG